VITKDLCSYTTIILHRAATGPACPAQAPPRWRTCRRCRGPR
jgi:hypothetical protein